MTGVEGKAALTESPGQTLNPPSRDSHNKLGEWGRIFPKRQCCFGKEFETGSYPTGFEPCFCTSSTEVTRTHCFLFLSLALPSCELVVVTFLTRSCFESWLRYLDSSAPYVNWHTQMLGTLSPLSRSSAFWCVNLSVKEGKKLGKRCRGSSGWAGHSVIVLRPL